MANAKFAVEFQSDRFSPDAHLAYYETEQGRKVYLGIWTPDDQLGEYIDVLGEKETTYDYANWLTGVGMTANVYLAEGAPHAGYLTTGAMMVAEAKGDTQ